ncbi:MAG TPA: metallophosphoesterase family protein [Dehalococcoidia bacterium]|nr:metallophosphoesterase family protein [Dehalococcoidia bacterium]
MRIGIIADVHCNHQALRIALDRMGPVDELICAGDAVYQFRFSNEVMEILRERDARYILGNHEEVLLGKWGERARAADWVRPDDLAYMADHGSRLETTIGARKLVIVHGSPFEPHNEYIYPNSRSLSRMGEIEADYVILGHTHYQMAERVGRVLVINPGSAGEARDARNAFRLSYAILDTESGEVTFDDFQDPTRAAVDPSIIPGGAGQRGGGRNEATPPNSNFWRPG